MDFCFSILKLQSVQPFFFIFLCDDDESGMFTLMKLLHFCIYAHDFFYVLHFSIYTLGKTYQVLTISIFCISVLMLIFICFFMLKCFIFLKLLSSFYQHSQQTHTGEVPQAERRTAQCGT